MLLDWGNAFYVAVSVFVISLSGTAFLIKYLTKKAIMDIPNERSSHSVPTPRGGGIAVFFSIIIGFMCIRYFEDKSSWIVEPAKFETEIIIGIALLLSLMSWIDDKAGLSAGVRLLGHFIAVSGAVYLMPQDNVFFGGLLPPMLDKVLAVFLWVWFINLYNFMDGIDGITGVQTISIGLGLCLLLINDSIPEILGFYGLIVAFSAFGFLFYNWHPAKIFMGDVGSVSLGFIIGWLLLKSSSEGAWAAAIILPAYYLLDATYTLLKRAFQGKKFWQAHKEHFYQRTVQTGASHAQVSIMVLKINLGLIILAGVSQQATKPETLVFVAYLFAATMMNRMINWQTKEPTLRELKDDAVKIFKESYKETSENYKTVKERFSEEHQNDEEQEKSQEKEENK